MRSRLPLLSTVLVALWAAPVSAASIDVFPGPGTPIQEAITAAAEGDTIILHGGAYDEPIVVNKPLTIKAHPGESIATTAGGGAWGLDITADGVKIRAKPVLTIGCGSVGSIRVHDRTGVRIKGVVAGCGPHPIPGRVGWDIQRVDKLAITGAGGVGDVGCHVANQPLGAKVLLKAFSCYGETNGLVLENIAPGALLGRSGLKILVGDFVIGPMNAQQGAKLVSADGVRFLKSARLWGGTAAAPGITLDADSDNNVIEKSEDIRGAVDLGSGNCWKHNSGTGAPTTCP